MADQGKKTLRIRSGKEGVRNMSDVKVVQFIEDSYNKNNMLDRFNIF